MSFSFALVRVVDPLIPSYSPFPLMLSPWIQIHPYLDSRGGRGQGSSTAYSEEKEAE